MKTTTPHIISLGGSLMVPDGLDLDFLGLWSKLVLSLTERGHRFVILPGGGALARAYQAGLRELSVEESPLLDRAGMAAIMLNAEFLRALFGKRAHPSVVTDMGSLKRLKHPIAVAALLEEGRSSDWGAVVSARALSADTIINLSDIAHVYDRDPNIDHNARAFRTLSWEEYCKLMGPSWSPGLKVPFDPVSARQAQEHGLTVAMLRGQDTDALERFLERGECLGTLIGP